MDGRYSIATVAQLVGAPVDTLRTWERRYGVVSPERSAGGQRRYTSSDVERLRLVRALVVTYGERISMVATLPTEELEARLELLSSVAPSAPAHDAPAPVAAGPVRVAVRRSGPTTQLGGASCSGVGIELVECADPDPEDFDVLLIGPGDRLTPAELGEMRHTHGYPPTVLLYTFLPEAERAELSGPAVRLVSTPRPASELRQAIVDFFLAYGAIQGASESTPGPTRFTDDQLDRMSESHSDLACACPNHTARIVQALVAFEHYSLQCANDTPADAAVHTALAEGTARARAEMEGILMAVCEHDGLSLTP